MTDKQHNTRNDTQKAGGELQGRTHTEDRTGQATEHTAAGAEGKRREGRKGGRREGHGWPRMATRLGSGGGDKRFTADRQKEGREKRACNIFKGEKREKTPPRLAKACKHVHIHFAQYRGVLAVYCTFFYIL